MKTIYIIQSWDKFNRRWEPVAGDMRDSLETNKRRAYQSAAELARGWQCPRSDIKIETARSLDELRDALKYGGNYDDGELLEMVGNL